MGSDTHEEKEPEISAEEMKARDIWVTLAMIHGFNHMANIAEGLDEKTFFRMARDGAERAARELGVDIQVNGDEVILTLPYARARVNFTARDIDLMRKCIADWDAAHPVVPSLAEQAYPEAFACNCSQEGGPGQHSFTCPAYGSSAL